VIGFLLSSRLFIFPLSPRGVVSLFVARDSPACPRPVTGLSELLPSVTAVPPSSLFCCLFPFSVEWPSDCSPVGGEELRAYVSDLRRFILFVSRLHFLGFTDRLYVFTLVVLVP